MVCYISCIRPLSLDLSIEIVLDFIGLRKEDLEFYFTDELLQDQTPETVHLMPQDEIWVQHRRRNDVGLVKQPTVDSFTDHLRKLLTDDSHYDVSFLIGSDPNHLYGHKAVFSARSEYFEAMFRKDGLCESSQDVVQIHGHDTATFKRAREFIYTNQVHDLDQCDADSLISLLMIANEYMLDDLKSFCSSYVEKVLSEDNVGKFMCLCSTHGISDIREICIRFVRMHHVSLRQNQYFCAEVEQNPELGLLLLDALPSGDVYDVMGSESISGLKRARVDESSMMRTNEIPSQSMSANTIQNNSFGSDAM
jgi:hypothetical protein